MKDLLLKIVRNPGVRKAAIGLVLAVAAALGLGGLGTGCAALAPSVTPDRALCYAAADRAAQARVDHECPADAGAFGECPAHDSIMAQLKADQEACP